MLKVSLPPSLQEFTQLCDTDVGRADCLYHKQVEVILFFFTRVDTFCENLKGV